MEIPEWRVRQAAPGKIRPVNITGDSPLSRQHRDRIADSMREYGWQGLPILAMDRDGDWQALTGSHRLDAAQEAGLESVPVVWVKQSKVLEWARAAGYDLPDDADLTDLEDEDRLAILEHSDDPIAREIMRAELEKGGRFEG